MAQSIKLNDNNYIDAEGVYDHTKGRTQAQMNSFVVDQTAGNTFSFRGMHVATVLLSDATRTLFYVQLPFVTRNENYSVTCPSVTITNVVSLNTQLFDKTNCGITFYVDGNYTSQYGAQLGPFTITFA